MILSQEEGRKELLKGSAQSRTKERGKGPL